MFPNMLEPMTAPGRRRTGTRGQRGRPKASQVHNKEGRNVVGLAPEVLLPKALLPEPEAFHVLVVVTERRETKWRPLKDATTF